MTVVTDAAGRDLSRFLRPGERIVALDGAGIPSARYNELAEVWEDPQVKHRQLRVTTPHPYAEAAWWT